MNDLQQAIHNLLRQNGDKTATQIRNGLSREWDISGDRLQAALQGMLTEGTVQRIKIYYRAVLLPRTKQQVALEKFRYMLEALEEQQSDDTKEGNTGRAEAFGILLRGLYCAKNAPNADGEITVTLKLAAGAGR